MEKLFDLLIENPAVRGSSNDKNTMRGVSEKVIALRYAVLCRKFGKFLSVYHGNGNWR